MKNQKLSNMADIIGASLLVLALSVFAISYILFIGGRLFKGEWMPKYETPALFGFLALFIGMLLGGEFAGIPGMSLIYVFLFHMIPAL